MTKVQIIEAIVGNFAGRLNAAIHPDLTLTEQGERDLWEALERQYMNQPNDVCVTEWVKVISFCPQITPISAE